MERVRVVGYIKVKVSDVTTTVLSDIRTANNS